MLKSKNLTEYDLAQMKESSLFSGINENVLKSVSSKFTIVEYSRTENIFSENSNSTDIFLILRGQVEIIKNFTNRKKFLITVLSAKENFGEMAFLTGSSRSASAVARTDCRLLLIHPETFTNSSFSDHCMTSNCIKFILMTNVAKKLAMNLDSLNLEYSRMMNLQGDFFADHHQENIFNLSSGISNIRKKYLR